MSERQSPPSKKLCTVSEPKYLLFIGKDVSEEGVKARELSITRLGQIYKDKALFDQLVQLTQETLPKILDLPKSKTGKIVRTLFDFCILCEGSKAQNLIELSHHIISWCDQESRGFLKMKIQCKLSDLYFQIEKFNDAIELLKDLLFELKKKEDKQLLVEAQLVESKVYHALENIPKAKASLTSVKTTAH